MNTSLKLKIQKTIEACRSDLLSFANDIWLHPELGYQEYRTREKLLTWFQNRNLSRISSFGLTGIKAWLGETTNPSLPKIAILGEMDAVISPQHPFADSVTHAAHACGHFAGLSAMLGAGMALTEAFPELAGNVCLIAVPAEEYVELSFREQLIQEGKIRYLGGKQQLISEGCFDDIDIAMMVHALTDSESPGIHVASTAGGFIGKSVQFSGKEAHAGGAPHLGVNALNAASAAIMCIHAVRETFRDEDHVRVHPIITKGGDLVNTVPADVRMESYVRAASIEAMRESNRKVNRAIYGASYAVGASCNIRDLPGYLPLHESKQLSQLFADNARLLLPDAQVRFSQPFCGSTDMGDLSFILPVIQPVISGFSGALHSKEFRMTNPDLAILLPAVLLAATAADLLSENGRIGWEVKQSFPTKTKEEYEALWQSFLAGEGGERL